MYRSVAGGSVRTHLSVLRACGFCRLSEASADGRSRAPHSVYRTLTLCLTGLYLVQECVYAYQEREDMGKLGRVMFLLLCHMTSIAKQLVFYCEADAVERLVAQLDEPCFNPDGDGAEIAEGAARWARRLLLAYAGCAVVTCTLWLVFPVMDRLHGLPVEFPFWVYGEQSRPLIFTLVLLYSYYVTTLIGIANTTMDALMAAVLDQCKTQFIILRRDFENLTERAERAAGIGFGKGYEIVVRDMFLNSLTHYNKITETTTLFQETFGTAILVQFGIGGWILCMAAYKIVNNIYTHVNKKDILTSVNNALQRRLRRRLLCSTLSAAGLELASMVLFTCCIFTELFLYCYYGNEVTVQSECVADSLYCMRWVNESAQLRRAILLVLQSRARRPLRVAAGRVVPLSLNTFVKIMKSSYSFYAVLRQTK